jgi:hypothetical protein
MSPFLNMLNANSIFFEKEMEAMKKQKKFQTYSAIDEYQNVKEKEGLKSNMLQARLNLISALRQFKNEKTDLDRMISVEQRDMLVNQLVTMNEIKDVTKGMKSMQELVKEQK